MTNNASNGRAGVPRPQRPAASVAATGEYGRAATHPPQAAILARDDQGALADGERAAAGKDHAESHNGLERGVNALEHELGRDVRQRAARQRGERGAQARLQTARERDEVAASRDRAALARDREADARDRAMARRDTAHERNTGSRAVAGAEIIMRAGDDRKRAARHRAQAALAAHDRQVAAEDREQAARDRRQAVADLEAFAHQLATAETDALTGARTRAAGLTDLDHQLDRCRRTDSTLVVAYVDVVGLKALNDSVGHAAGDALLKRVVAFINEHLRSSDLIMRLGGDEFLCAMSNMAMPDARQRFRAVGAALAAAPDPGSVGVSFAQLTPDETTTQLIARADSELVDSRRDNHDNRPRPADDTRPSPALMNTPSSRPPR